VVSSLECSSTHPRIRNSLILKERKVTDGERETDRQTDRQTDRENTKLTAKAERATEVAGVVP